MAQHDMPDLAFAPSNEVAHAELETGHDVGVELTDLDRRILIFERQWWKSPGAKEARIWREFRMSPARYYQVVGTLLDLPAALSFDPMLVRRLRRLRSANANARFPRRLNADWQ